MSRTRIVKSVTNVSLATFCSRVLGYIRDMLIAQIFGAGMVTDCFFVAYRIPNLLRNLLGEGSLSASFIPVFSSYLVKDKKEAKKVAHYFGFILIVVLVAFTILGVILSPFIVKLVAPGFVSQGEKLSLTITLTRILFPFILAIGLAVFSLGVLNSLRIFFIPASSPTLLNLTIIFYILFIYPSTNSVIGLAIAVVLGGFFQFLFQIPSIYKNGLGLTFSSIKNIITDGYRKIISHPGIKKIFLLFIPAAVGFSVHQINIFVDTMCASLLREGSISFLYYANRLMQLPLALFGTAVATVSLPLMSSAFAQKNRFEVKQTLIKGIRIILFFVLPASIGLIFLGKPIIKLLFERGKFTSYSTQLTYGALLFYSIGIIAYSGMKLFVSAFYSYQDTFTPVLIATIILVVNIVLNLILMFPLGIKGIALATSISGYLHLLILFIKFRKKIGGIGLLDIRNSLFKIIISSIAMGISLFIFLKFTNNLSTLLIVVLGLFIGTGSYLVFSALLHSEEINLVRNLMRKSVKRDNTDNKL